MTTPLLSVLLVTCDDEASVERALTSIECQVIDEAIEVVVADNASTDRTPAIVAAWSERVGIDVRVLPGEERLGAALNHHRGLAACRGRYVAVLHGDDEWGSTDTLRLQAQLLDGHPELSMTASRATADDGSAVTPSGAMYRADLVERLDPGVFETRDDAPLIDLAMAEYGTVGRLPQVAGAPSEARTASPGRPGDEPSAQPGRIVVLDDYFPRTSTGFRIAEFDWMVRHGVVAEVMTTAQPLEPLLAEYARLYPQSAQQVSAYDPGRLSEYDCASIMFLNNAARFLPDLERQGLPFVLTLYPGGGLHLDEPVARRKLKRVLGSPLLKHVITTQPLVTDLVKTATGGSVPVTEVLGGAVGTNYLEPGAGLRTEYFGSGKPFLDVCFVAGRYTADGSDKGWPAFLETLRLLKSAGLPVRGHVVGGFGAADVGAEYSELELSFSGVLNTADLREFYLDKDIIVSPTVPGRLAPGAFDGFPTGACVEAALCGVAVASTDPLEQCRIFTDAHDILLTGADGAEIAQRVCDLVAEADGLRRLAQEGLRTTRRAYGVDAQLWSRRRVLGATSAMAGERADQQPVVTGDRLVSILVPTYNGERFLRATLRSALGQSYRNIEVIVGDDGSTDGTPQILEAVAAEDPRVRVLRFDRNIGALENPRRLLAEARGEYVKFLMHDDILGTDCLRELVRGLEQHLEATMAFSHRLLINEDGKPVPGREFPKLLDRPGLVGGRQLGDHVLLNCSNVIGEPTTVLFRREDVPPEDLWLLDGRTVDVLNDVQLWLQLLAQGPAFYTPRSLSRFRQHASQNSFNPKYVGRAERDWSRLIDWGARNGFLADVRQQRQAHARALTLATARITQMIDGPHYGGALEAAFLSTARLVELTDPTRAGDNRDLAVRAHDRPVLDRFAQELDVWTREYPFALAAPALEPAEIGATVQAMREVMRTGITERALLAVPSSEVDRAVPLVEAALAAGEDIGLELVPTDEPATMLTEPWLAVVPHGGTWHDGRSLAVWRFDCSVPMGSSARDSLHVA